MSKRILTGIACLGIVWVVGANAERLLGDDPYENAMQEGGFAGNQITVEEEEEVESDNPFEDMPDESSRGRGRGEGMRRPGMGGGMGMAMGRSGMAGRVNAAASESAGTFSVVSDDKRSIMVNTTTGNSWLLVIDNPGTHWEPIKMPGAAEQASLSPWGAEAPESPVSDDDTLTEVKLKQAVEFAKNSARQKDQLVEKLKDAYGNIGELKSTVETLVQHEKTLAKEVNDLSDKRSELELEITNFKIYVDELKKELKDAQELLKARDKEAQADVIDASQCSNNDRASSRIRQQFLVCDDAQYAQTNCRHRLPIGDRLFRDSVDA